MIRWFLTSLLLFCGVAHSLQLKAAPLIGGPSWLPLHVKVIVQEGHSWDFVPLNATQPDTLKSLLKLQSVPGEIRYFGKDDDDDDTPTLRRARAFVDDYTNRDLNLIQNNCWTFALMLYWHLRIDDDVDEDGR